MRSHRWIPVLAALCVAASVGAPSAPAQSPPLGAVSESSVPDGTPTLSVTLSVDPALSVLGTNITWRTSVSGGASPYSYNYAHLPLGCADLDSAVLPCRPVAAGSYLVTVDVIDIDGITGSANATVALYGPSDPHSTLSMVSFFASPSTIASGGTTTFTVVTSGAVGRLSYYYANLPEGCRTQSQPDLTCQPDAHYTNTTLTVAVSVIDGTGQEVGASAELTIGSGEGTSSSLSVPRVSSLEFWGLVFLISLAGAVAVFARTRDRRPPPSPAATPYALTLSGLHARSPPRPTSPPSPSGPWGPPTN